MLSLAPFAKVFLRWAAGLAVTLGAIYLLLVTVGLAPTPHTCITEIHKRFFDVSGFDFEISETDCSTLGEDASISVFASKSGQTKKTLLLKYGPAGVDPLPVITSVDQHTVQISVSRISDLLFHLDNWEGLSVNYNIGVVDYPARGAEEHG
jgi:hypothetical protein